MKVKDIEDCSNCPLFDESCQGGMSGGPGGNPIEPPCVNWTDPEEDIGDLVDDYYAREYAREQYIMEQWEYEEKQEDKKKLQQQRRRESARHVAQETRKIKQLRKKYEALFEFNSLANAFSITNKIFNKKDERVEQSKSAIEQDMENVLYEIKVQEDIKKQKLKELRQKRKS